MNTTQGKVYGFRPFDRFPTVGGGGGGEISFPPLALDSDALDWYSRVETDGGSFDQTSIDPTYNATYVKQAISDWVAYSKVYGLWDKYLEVVMFFGSGYTGLRQKFKGFDMSNPLLSFTGFSSARQVPVGAVPGLKADGNNDYVEISNTGEDELTDNVNSHISLFVTQTPSSGNRVYCGYRETVIMNTNTDLRIAIADDGKWLIIPEEQNSIGFIIGQRVSSTDLEAFVNGTKYTGTFGAAGGNSIGGFNLFKRTLFGADDYSDTRIALLTAGKDSFSDQEAEYARLITKNLANQLGCNII